MRLDIYNIILRIINLGVFTSKHDIEREAVAFVRSNYPLNDAEFESVREEIHHRCSNLDIE